MLRPLRSLQASQGLDWVQMQQVLQQVPLALLELVLLQELRQLCQQGGQHLYR